MTSSTPMSRVAGWARRSSAVLAFWTLLPAAARAHTSLKSSEPAAGARLVVPPTQLLLRFTARPQVVFSSLRLVGPSGDVALGPLVADSGNVLRAGIRDSLAPGEYRIEWRTASADGHPVAGGLTFVVARAADLQAPVPPAAPVERVEPESSGAASLVARWIEFLTLFTVIGALGFRHAVLPPLAARSVATADAAARARRLGEGALALYVIAAAMRLYAQAAAVRATGAAIDAHAIRVMLTGSVWGVGWLMGALGAVVVFIAWRVSERSTAAGTPLALSGAVGMTMAPAFSGHAAAASHFIVSVTLDVMHVAAAGVWLGGLLMVIVAGLPAMRRLTDGNPDAAVGALVSSFHPLALFCAPIVVIAGAGTSWIRLGSVEALWTSAYGQMLLRKLFFFACVAGMAAYNGFRARRRLGTPEGTRRLRRTGSIELVFASLVLAATALLVSLPMPAEAMLP